VGTAPHGLKAKTGRGHVRSLQQEGYQVELSLVHDKHGHPRPTLSAIWRNKR
jgi:hypothetical protein